MVRNLVQGGGSDSMYRLVRSMATDRRQNTPEAKRATPEHAIAPVFRKRWSPRSFADKPVEPGKIRRMLEAARWTMSSYNEQPWRYMVARGSDADAYDAMLNCLTEGNQEWASLAPVLMLSFYKRTFRRNDEPNRCAPHDLGAASAALTFQAQTMGIYVHQMAGIRTDVIESTYDVPEDVTPMAGLAVGYVGDPEQLPESRREAERAPRSRKTLDEFVFGGEWGTPSPLVTS